MLGRLRRRTRIIGCEGIERQPWRGDAVAVQFRRVPDSRGWADADADRAITFPKATVYVVRAELENWNGSALDDDDRTGVTRRKTGTSGDWS
jgi:hypothetical protein